MTTKKKAIVLGATGMMGQKFVQLLSHHPWFEISALAASDKSIGKTYGSAVAGRSEGQLPEILQELQIVEPSSRAVDDPDLVFSALPAEVAGPIEEEFAEAGMPVFSNASSHRMDEFVPLMNPEVNPEHASLVEDQRRRKKIDGFIVANPNCTTAVLTLSLKPLSDKFGLDTVVVSSMQAISGAGYPGVASLDILENVIPFIRNEEEKVQRETNKILGSSTKPALITVSASCHRVPTIHGHIEAVFAKTHSLISPEEASKVMSEFTSVPQHLKLPSAPAHPIIVRSEEDRPQTRLDVDEGRGMSVSVGRIRADPALKGIKYIVLGHNLVRGGAGCSILNAELLLAKKYIQ
ncbi:MAG TPA: aspartate-semialdehyde dehydrogenase [Candidatus Bathyarchaeia archaeon]|nr:aspartate-semialdehyde dehydrogenase [Candidatus Bathyarchaeia archaeon]